VKPKNFHGQRIEAMIPIGSVTGPLIRVWEYLKQRSLKKLAWNLRECADRERQRMPTFAFSVNWITRQLGSSGHRVREVLEFMEVKGWAVKARNLANSWHIN